MLVEGHSGSMGPRPDVPSLRPMTAQKENKGKVQDVDRKRNMCTCAVCVCACACVLKGYGCCCCYRQKSAWVHRASRPQGDGDTWALFLTAKASQTFWTETVQTEGLISFLTSDGN